MSTELIQRGDVHVSHPTAYSFRFGDHGGWAIFTVNDDTGEFTVQSDWGSYCHRWNTGALGDGVKLTQFLTECLGEYLVEKLKLDTRSKELDDVIDDEATENEVRRRICELRRCGDLTKAEARSLWLDVEEWQAHGFALEAWHLDSHVAEIDVSEFIVRAPSCRYCFLRDKLLPFFTRWLRENVVSKQSEELHG